MSDWGNSIPGAQAGMEMQKQSNPRHRTRREILLYRRQEITNSLDVIDKALAALDAHPELEEFIETLAKAGT